MEQLRSQHDEVAARNHDLSERERNEVETRDQEREDYVDGTLPPLYPRPRLSNLDRRVEATIRKTRTS